MPVPHLTAVPNDTPASGAPAEVYDLGRGVESGAQRVRRLQKEARILAHEQVEILARDLDAIGLRAAEIAEGGDAYPAGVRELASRVAADLPLKAQGLASLMERTARG
jgi:hypothetical protein